MAVFNPQTTRELVRELYRCPRCGDEIIAFDICAATYSSPLFCAQCNEQMKMAKDERAIMFGVVFRDDKGEECARVRISGDEILDHIAEFIESLDSGCGQIELHHPNCELFDED